MIEAGVQSVLEREAIRDLVQQSGWLMDQERFAE